MFICIFFFFSSRRRHTRCSRDWSSDVCSSDLSFTQSCDSSRHLADIPASVVEESQDWVKDVRPGNDASPRSEERRVGKECRSRGVPYLSIEDVKLTQFAEYIGGTYAYSAVIDC